MSGGDPSPLRFRTYAAIPVLNTGLLVFGAGARALWGAEELAFWAVWPAAIALFACGFVGVHGLVHDARRLNASGASWTPSERRYLTGVALLAAALTAAAVTEPVSTPTAPGVLPTYLVCSALAVGPVNAVYLVRRYTVGRPCD